MANNELAAIFNLEPTDSINYLRKKGYQISFNWREVWREAHAKSFTVAGVLKLDVLTDIKTALDDVLTTGGTFKSFLDNLMPTLEQKGWLGKGYLFDGDTGEIEGKLLNPRRLDTIFRTNTQTAYMAGRYKQMRENVEFRPYWMYVAVEDARTRPAHARFHGRVFRYDDPIWQYLFPPNGFNCRCSVRALSEADIKRLGLTVESSEGMLSEKEQLINEKESRPGIQYNGEFFADPGFDYNPGQAAFEPELADYPPALVAQYKRYIAHDN